MPTLVMVAGPNGSGKSTLIGALRADPVFGPQLPSLYVNADDLQRERRLDVLTAQRTAAELRERAVVERRDLLVETVMSHPSKLAELQRARELGYEIHVFFVATADPAINVDRVRLRVKAGGHDVPPDKTVARHARTLRYAPAALSLADHASVLDNSHASRGIDFQAVLHGGLVRITSAEPAPWVAQLADLVNMRARELARWQADAVERGWQLHGARWSSGRSTGVMEIVSAHHAIQREPGDPACVVHDLSLLPRQVKPGEDLLVLYDEGTCRLDPHGARR